MVDSPFEKAFNDLDDTEKRLWDLAAEVLNRGDRLYGNSPNDQSHVWWALGLALHSLREEQSNLTADKPSAAIYLEVGCDENGFWISPIKADEDQDSKQPQEIS